MNIVIYIIVLSFTLNATDWTINAGNFYYTPASLEIQIGDTVEWINDGGYHDANGDINTITGDSFNNPESFYVGPATSNSIIGSYTFSIAGVYNYDCSVGNHAVNGMVGTIVVSALDVEGCTDSNAISCDDDIDTLYFPECTSCSEGVACDNYYNPSATVDNGLCMYSDIPSSEQFLINQTSTGFDLDWSAFTPPVDIEQYVLQRCLDPDGDSDGDGELEYENCVMLIAPGTFYLETTYSDDIGENDGFSKYTLYVHYPNNNYWGSAQGYYYYDNESECTAGDVSGDGIINVIDIVSLVNHILGSNILDDTCAADLNSDGIINVIDIVSLVNLILS